MEITSITPSELIASFAHGDDVSRDLETFNKFRPVEFSIRLLKDALLFSPIFYGLSINTHDAYRAYARHVWQQTRKPRSVYRGGRWRQMDALTQQKAILWAMEAGRDDRNPRT